MSFDRYLLLRKAAEIEQLNQRISDLSDLFAAFSGNGKHMNKLIQTLTKIQNVSEDEIHFEKDKDAVERMRKWQR